MKKRLLSAALALAMVLTLLPMSVFAATDATSVDDGTQVTMAADGTTLTWTYTDAADGNKSKTGTNTFTSGVIVGGTRSSSTGTVSGKYYSTFSEDAYKAGNSFTLLGDTALPTLGTDVNYKNITVDVNGHTLQNISLTWTLDSNNRVEAKYSSFNNLTVKNTGTASSGAVTGSIAVKGMNFTLNMTNVASTSSAVTAELDNTGIATNPPSNTLTVTLNNSTMGTITAKNAKISVNATNKSKTGNVITAATTDGANPRTGGSVILGTSSQIDGTLGMYGQGTVTLTGRSEITGETTLFGAKKGDGGNADATPNWKTTMTVDNSTTGAITQAATDENGHRIDVKNNSTVGNITMNVGGTSDIDIADSKPTTAPTVSIAAGTVDIKNSNVSNVTAGKANETAGSTITVGTRNQADTSVVGNIEGVATGATPKLVLNSGKVGTIGQSQAVSHEVWGGSAKTAIDKANLKNGLDKGYQVLSQTYYTYTTKFQDVIDIFKADGSAKAQLVGETLAGGGKDIDITFQWEDTAAPVTLAKITISKGNYLTLPTEVNNTTVQYWYDQTTTGTAGNDEGLHAGKAYMFSQATILSTKIGENPAHKLTGVKAVDAYDTSYPIGATINNTAKTIDLSGALKTNGETGRATVTLEIDGTELGDTISVGWHAPSGTITLNGTAGSGITFPISRSDQVQIYDTLYTVTGTGLRAKVSKVEIVSNVNSIPITVSNANGGMSGSYTVTGQNLKTAFEDVNKSNVDFSDATGVKAALNALVAGLSEGSVTSMANSARSAHASYQNKYNKKTSGSWTANDFLAYDTVELSPYLDIVAAGNPTISGSGNPSITLTITLKYRYKVKDASNKYALRDKDSAGKDIAWEQTGNLTVSGDCGQVDIDLTMPTELKFADGSQSYAHYDGQVYEVSWTTNKATIENLNGFAVTKFEINNTAPTVTVTNGSDTLTFDNLQDGVDAVKDGGEIEVDDNFNGTITVSGTARKFTVKAASGKTVTITGVNGASTTYEYNTSSNEYVIQLTADTTPVGGNITISTAAGGSASVNANPAKVGSTVTITLSANAGYTASGVSVKTASGQTVSVSGSGSSYTFTMPSGSVTVTPSFTKTNTNATISVNRAITGTGTASTNASGQVSPGTQVTVTTTPGAGQRTMGLSVTGATAIRTGVNTFTFTVPSGYSTVTVTPSFDANNNTIFADVWSSSYYSKAVSWAVNKNPQVTNGSDTYNFSPEDVCNRAQMVTFLWRAAGRPSVAGIANPFVDVSATQTPGDYYSAILWAVSQGITDGTDRTHFSPYATVTRGQAVTFLYRYEKSPAASTNSGFYDVSSREYYARPVSWANAKGVTKGTSTTMFSPNDPVTRAQAVTFLYRDVTGDIA